jgi:phosphoribosylformimino-5-aminoimidazole carboxamide ribotide isomerase
MAVPGVDVRPALDLRGGRVVRLGEHGDFGRETAFASGPDQAVALAKAFVVAGARRLHVVDLDAARGDGDNRDLVGRLVSEAGAEVEVSGGVRSADDVERWLAAGAGVVAIGTAAVRDPALLEAVARRHPGRVAAALDVRGGLPAVRGWAAVEQRTVAEVLAGWAGAALESVIVTSVDRDGTMAGPDLALLHDVLSATVHPVTYSGGVASLADVKLLAAAGAAAVILGRSLLEGHVQLAEALAAARGGSARA